MQSSNDSLRRTLRSEDGSLVFHLLRLPTGLYIERVRVLKNGTRVVQSAVLSDGAALAQWCDKDALRFEFPLIFAMLKRDGTHLLGP
jgi:hypothetical protein